MIRPYTDPSRPASSVARRTDGLVQTVVDVKHYLIVDHRVTNVGNDRQQLATMARRAQAVMQVEHLEAVADRGYFNGNTIEECEDAGITAYVPKPQTSNNQAQGLFGERDFVYQPKTDTYRCPAGQSLIWRYRSTEGELEMDCYWSSACGRCPIKAQCTTGSNRRVKHWVHENVLEAMQQRLDHDPGKMRTRRCTVEHPFGTLKACMGYTHFLTRRLEHVSTEMSLHVLAYNLKRVMRIVGMAPLMEAVAA